MKKQIALMILFIGLISFANNNTAKDVSVKNFEEVTNCYDNIDTNIENTDYIIDVSATAYECTATVYYNGVEVASFTVTAIDESFIGMACQLAKAQAMEYIANHQ